MTTSDRTFDRYTLLGEIGRGGFAVVYKAFDPRFRREVAIKVLPTHFLHDPRFRARFEDEAHTIASLEHPAIVPVYDFGEHEGQPFLVMRYMPGGTLRGRMNKKPLPLPEVARILAELAPALDKAHERGIIHRDIKPDNVLFDEDGRSYLGDFGIARMAEATHTMTITGTPAYMSPEQVKGDQTLDGRGDIYALGVMLFELLTGQQPYVADTPTKQMMKHVLEPVPHVLVLNPNLPAVCQIIIERAMAKEPAARYGTAQALAHAVSQLLTKAQPLAPTVIEPRPPAPRPSGQRLREGIGSRWLMEKQSAPPPIKDVAQLRAEKKPVIVVSALQRKQWLWAGGVVVGLVLVWLLVQAAGLFGNVPLTAVPTHMPQPVAVIVTTVAATEVVVNRATLTEESTSSLTLTPTVIIASPTLTSKPTPTPTTVPTLTAGTERVREKDLATVVYVPAGTFPMGSNAAESSDEFPQHDVTLDSFWIDKYEVTNEKYLRCVNDGSCEPSGFADDRRFNGTDFPVVGVSWNDAEAYCAWAGGRLPTEAEWEYAARGKDGRLFPWDNDNGSCSVANYGRCIGTTTVVGSYPEGVSWVNAFDMAGNVWEWVQDWYAANYYENSPRENPPGPKAGTSKVLRGGSWFFDERNVRAAFRFDGSPADSNDDVGFRCAQE